MTQVLLDTHALWWLLGSEVSLGRGASRIIRAALRRDSLVVSAISFWEIAMLLSRQKLTLDTSVATWRQQVLQLGIREVAVSGDIGIAAVELSDFHADPADRIIAATAASQGATLLTADERLLSWQGPLRRHDART